MFALCWLACAGWGCGKTEEVGLPTTHDGAPNAAGHEGHTASEMAGMPGMDKNVAPAIVIPVSPSAAGVIGLRVAPVRAGVGTMLRRAPAFARFDPTRSVRVTTQSGGQLRSVRLPAPGEAVIRGQVLAELYDPSLAAVLAELRLARELGDPWLGATSARARAMGIGADQVSAVLQGLQVPETVTIHSPISGIVSSGSAPEGTWLAPGGVIAILVDPAAVLIDVVVDGVPPAVGTNLILRDGTGNAAGVVASVVALLPEATSAGAVVRVLPAAAVTPGRPLLAEWTQETAISLWVPIDALVDTGTRQVVFVQTGAGFVPRAVVPGVRAGNEVEIRTGLAPGESVAGSAAFLLDSETQVGAMSHAGHGG